jgi:hypothetical protein
VKLRIWAYSALTQTVVTSFRTSDDVNTCLIWLNQRCALSCRLQRYITVAQGVVEDIQPSIQC